MYSTPTCGYCEKAKVFFNKNKIKFTEKDISADERAQSQFARLGGRGVPLILVGTKEGMKKIYGFDQGRLTALLKR